MVQAPHPCIVTHLLLAHGLLTRARRDICPMEKELQGSGNIYAKNEFNQQKTSQHHKDICLALGKESLGKHDDASTHLTKANADSWECRGAPQ